MQTIGRSVGAALAMGNACVLKPAEEAGAALSCRPGVAHLSFTGSVAVGQMIQAAAAMNTIPVTLELGGKARRSCLPMPMPMPTWPWPCPSWSMPASRTAAMIGQGDSGRSDVASNVKREVYDALLEKHGLAR